MWCPRLLCGFPPPPHTSSCPIFFFFFSRTLPLPGLPSSRLRSRIPGEHPQSGFLAPSSCVTPCSWAGNFCSVVLLNAFFKKIPLAAATSLFFVVRCHDWNLAALTSQFPFDDDFACSEAYQTEGSRTGSGLEAVSGPRQLLYRQLHLF